MLTTKTIVRAGILVLFVGFGVARAQTSASQFQTVLKTLESIPPYPASASPAKGMFYTLQFGEQWPPLPANTLNLDFWDLGDGYYILDDRGVDYTQRLQESQLMMMETDDPSPPGGGGGGSGGGPVWVPPAYDYSSNDLWLYIAECTNNVASLVIHPPWYATNEVYDLQYCTNLTAPTTWQWLLRTDVAQTNLAVTNATDAYRFYRLGPPNDLKVESSLGTNFWVGFFKLDDRFGTPQLSLYITSPVGAAGTVTIPGLGFTSAFSVAARAVTNIGLPLEAMMVQFVERQTNGIHITASQPVSVYGVDYNHSASTALTCYPTPLLGTNYCVMARGAMIPDDNEYSYYAELAIAATADNTTVVVRPSASVNIMNHIGENLFTNILQQGETLQLVSANNYEDVTGTRITSDKPVAVFAGANCAYVPDENTLYGNPLILEQLPVDAWGTQALALSFAGRTNGASYRVLAAYNDTVITIKGTVVTVTTNGPPWTVTTSNQVVVVTNQAGERYDIIVDGPVEIQGSKPIQVAQFANGTYSDHGTAPFDGDPCGILLPPTGHYLVTNIVFTLTNDLPDQLTGDFKRSFLNIIVATSAISNTLLDDAHIVATNFVPIGTSGYSGAQVALTNSGVHKVIGSQPVGVQVYGWGQYEAYGYTSGVVK